MNQHEIINKKNVQGSPSESNFPPKPKRPLTIFNMFSILERNFIVQTSRKSHEQPPSKLESHKSESNNCEVSGVDPYLDMRPEKYRDVVLPANWFKVGANKHKRQDHVNHGVISFTGLTNTVSMRWSTVDDETRRFLKMIYRDELECYRREMAAYIKMYGQEAFDAQKRKYTKRNEGNQNNSIAEGSDRKSRASPRKITLQSRKKDEDGSPKMKPNSPTSIQGRVMAASTGHASSFDLSQLQSDAADTQPRPYATNPRSGLPPWDMGMSSDSASVSNSNQLQRAEAGTQVTSPCVYTHASTMIPSDDRATNIRGSASHSHFGSQALYCPLVNDNRRAYGQNDYSNPLTFPNAGTQRERRTLFPDGNDPSFSGISSSQSNPLSFAQYSTQDERYRLSSADCVAAAHLQLRQFQNVLTFGSGQNAPSSVEVSNTSSREDAANFRRLSLWLDQLWQNRSVSGSQTYSHSQSNTSTFESNTSSDHAGMPPTAHLARPVMAGPQPSRGKRDFSTHGSNEDLLSDYLPAFDRSEAMELLNNNTDNILCGAELERAFDSDSSEE